jgi:hypothetical protein
LKGGLPAWTEAREMAELDGGLDLESFLLLLRADLGALALFGLGILGLGLMAWLSWGSRRALRKCLALSIAAHAGLVLYGSTVPAVFRALSSVPRNAAREQHIRKIRVSPEATKHEPPAKGGLEDGRTPAVDSSDIGRRPKPLPSLDLASGPIPLVGPSAEVARAEARARFETPMTPPGGYSAQPSLPISKAIPAGTVQRVPGSMESRPREKVPSAGPPRPDAVGVPASSELAQLVPEPEVLKEENGSKKSALSAPAASLLSPAELRHEAARVQGKTDVPALPRGDDVRQPFPPVRAIPGANSRATMVPTLAELAGPSGSYNLIEVPRFYRSRLDANRSALAQRSGASSASEQAVERALDWLARHQDPDGRWDGGTARYEDGAAVQGDDDFTVHCPPGQTCFGECAYSEADTALTGLALLTYLGAGYTHKDGKFATTVANGLAFLLAQQKPDGDLRGTSRAVGMYCHAMSTLALCEGYALSLDDRLRDPAERAVSFLVRGRARDGQAWRYEPFAAEGDTSILGWVVMALKSAREVGLRVPDQAGVSRGMLKWLDRVATGHNKGLARYQPPDPVTATMTAEAWVCRQFLGIGGPGASSAEAAAYLMQHESDKGESNYYYWYYGTLALYQHGGTSWSRWNARLRDRIVELQRAKGHQSGSWDPDESIYGARGGRIYCTTLAALTLEVYYRYLRLYDKPKLSADSKNGEEASAAP